MEKQEFIDSVVAMFEQTTKERLIEKLNSVLNSGCIDETELDIPSAKTFLVAFFEAESHNWTPPVNSSYNRRFKKQKRAMAYYI